MFATHPKYQNKGYGTKLIQFLGKIADKEGVLSILETAGIKNTTFYKL